MVTTLSRHHFKCAHTLTISSMQNATRATNQVEMGIVETNQVQSAVGMMKSIERTNKGLMCALSGILTCNVKS